MNAAEAAEFARLKRRIADLEDDVRSARQAVGAEQDAQRAHALTCPVQLRRPIPLTDTPKD